MNSPQPTRAGHAETGSAASVGAENQGCGINGIRHVTRTGSVAHPRTLAVCASALA